MTTTRQRIAAAAIALLGASAAFAQEATPDTWLQSAQSTKSRADVSAELTAARQSGLTKAWSAGYMEPVRSSALRAEIKAATLQAIGSGEIKAINAEVYGYTPAAPVRLSQAAR
ncbi:DUF4148 domain-containing protein [Pseudaquabacterium pictum]|uniref:DUF4148 domain-containing protein n=1 Tax=Pseudaquabacterium pictum TaxID=2315236 RepID=A0A480B0A4_9BURK|nr:DUF4148 domain-containing protein [Rubrivivax pictus]GCL65767.1 hypothetical protein AQPW35_48480 [Rubrivivax pictus]